MGKGGPRATLDSSGVGEPPITGRDHPRSGSRLRKKFSPKLGQVAPRARRNQRARQMALSFLSKRVSQLVAVSSAAPVLTVSSWVVPSTAKIVATLVRERQCGRVEHRPRRWCPNLKLSDRRRQNGRNRI